MNDLERRLERLEKVEKKKDRPKTVLLYGDEPIPEGTLPNALIIRYTGNASPHDL